MLRSRRNAEESANPAFPLTVQEAQRDLRRMMADPRPLPRPLVILDGYIDPHIAAASLKRTFRRISGDRRIIALSFFWHYAFRTCRAKVVAAVDRRFPSDDPLWTEEVDVIGFSMGGLVGRHAAARLEPERQHRRLRIARLFTIGTPHRGADLAALPAPTRLQRDMRHGSDFLADLGQAMKQRPYPVYPYVRLRDRVVGASHTAPEGTAPWWVPNRPFEPAHLLAFRDPRILADIARRLRDEQPLTRDPPTPVPP